MEAKAVDQGHKKHKAPGAATKHGKRSKSTAKHHKRKGHHKSKKHQKKGGFLCCRKKRKSSKKSKSKVTKKQPRSKVLKQLPPVPNEQLGEIVLVKNLNQAEKPNTPSKEPNSKKDVKPAKMEPPPKISMSKENDLDESKENSNEKEKGKVDGKSDSKKKGKKDFSKEDEDPSKNNNKKEKMEKWTKLAKRIVDEDANLAVNDFDQVASYIPPHVTKHNFVQNMSNNRFADVVCVDHSCVSLNDDTYIHASWVDLNNQKKAILTQLPLPHTAADFWQMIIEQRVKCILLILTDQEYECLGGDFVFPRNQDFVSFEQRSIRVGEFKQVEIAKGWNLKVLSVTNGDYKSFLHVHHYKSWSHNSVPSNLKQMWQVQSSLRQYSNPPVYMSLSGCGRAGTYALFEAAHSSLHSDQPSFDMVKCLENIRNGRVHSVQNLSQFSFVYTLIAEHILGNGFCKVVKKGGEEEADSVDAVLRQLTIQ